jgi:hypothetical protein
MQPRKHVTLPPTAGEINTDDDDDDDDNAVSHKFGPCAKIGRLAQ